MSYTFFSKSLTLDLHPNRRGPFPKRKKPLVHHAPLLSWLMRHMGKESYESPSPRRPSFTPLASASSSLPPFLLLPLFHTLPLGSLFGVPSSWALHQGPLKGHRASSQPLILADFLCADLSFVTWETRGNKGQVNKVWRKAAVLWLPGVRRSHSSCWNFGKGREKRDTWVWKGENKWDTPASATPGGSLLFGDNLKVLSDIFHQLCSGDGGL